MQTKLMTMRRAAAGLILLVTVSAVALPGCWARLKVEYDGTIVNGVCKAGGNECKVELEGEISTD